MATVYKLKKIIVGIHNYSAHFAIISHYKNIGYNINYKNIGYNINVSQQTACFVVNPIRFGNFAFSFYCTRWCWGRASASMIVLT